MADIDLGVIRENSRRLAEFARPTRIMAVVKADGYGHGAVEVATALIHEGVEWFAVATVQEAIELREAGVTQPLLVMGAILPDALDAYRHFGLDATIGSEIGLRAVLDNDGATIRCHLKIDTGMGRIGLDPTRTPTAIQSLRSAPGAALVGLSTHLSSADDDEIGYTVSQIERFRRAIAGVDPSDLIIHMENTEAIARSGFDAAGYPNVMARVGIGLYGCPIRLDTREKLGLRPAMTLHARITNIKKVEPGATISYNRRWIADRSTHIATVGIGYADGYPRSVAGKAHVRAAGVDCPVVGTICMDMIMVDLGPAEPRVVVGDTVTLFGGDGPDVSEVANWGNTITYEVVCGVGRRVQRRFS